MCRFLATVCWQDFVSTVEYCFIIYCRLSTRSKARRQTKASNTHRQHKAPPSKQATFNLSLSSATSLEKTPSEDDTPANEALPSAIPEEAPVSSSHSLTTPGADSSSDGDKVKPTTTAENQKLTSSAHEEEPPLFPSSPKTPKREESSPSLKHSSPAAESTATITPPTRSRKNLAARMKLASSDPHTSSLLLPTSHEPSTSSKLPSSGSANRLRNFSAKALAQRTAPENKTLVKPSSDVGPVASESGSTGSSPIRRLCGLSAKELAQQTEPERRMSARVARRNKGKSPTTPTSRAPQLHQFKSFVVQSPTKSPRYAHDHAILSVVDIGVR